MEGLVLNASMVLSYDGRGDPRSMRDVQSRCIDAIICGGNKVADILEESTTESTTTAKILPSQTGYAQVSKRVYEAAF